MELSSMSVSISLCYRALVGHSGQRYLRPKRIGGSDEAWFRCKRRMPEKHLRQNSRPDFAEARRRRSSERANSESSCRVGPSDEALLEVANNRASRTRTTRGRSAEIDV